MPEGEPTASQGTSAKAKDKPRKPTKSWVEELEMLHERLKCLHPCVDVRKTYLVPGWDRGEEAEPKDKGAGTAESKDKGDKGTATGPEGNQGTTAEPGAKESGSKRNRWQSLRNERDRIALIEKRLGWVSVDAADRVERRLLLAGEIIDEEISGRISEAARRLRQAENVLQRAWWSRYWNRCPGPRILPCWVWVALPLVPALGATAWAIVHLELYPREGNAELSEALYAAALWGFGGAVVNGLRTVHHRVQGQQFEKERLAWYVLSPILGLAFGAIAFLLLQVGDLSAAPPPAPTPSPTPTATSTPTPTATTTPTATVTLGLVPTVQSAERRPELVGVAAQPAEPAVPPVTATATTEPPRKQEQKQANGEERVDLTPIILLAVLAGFAQNSFLGALQQIIKARFRGADEQEETPV